MKKPLLLFLWLSVPLLCMAQRSLAFVYEYDNAGNRIRRKVIEVIPKLPPAPNPPDSLQVTSYELQGESLQELQVTSYVLQEVASPVSLVSPELATPEYFTETIAQVEMKIYPNPTTENITQQISNMETLQKGVLQLFTLNGQLLQTRLLSEAELIVSLAGLAKGTYILKVQINEITDDWKIIKQ